MKKHISIPLSLLLILLVAYAVYVYKEKSISITLKAEPNIGGFTSQKPCIRLPQFLQRMKIAQPVVIDLSQKRFTGIALYHGKGLKKTLHPKMWEKYGHFGTYALDRVGNMFLTPSPFISITPETFDLQTNIYKLDTKSGKIEIFMHLDDVHPSGQNPHGISSLVYDCDDHTLWVSAIDETSYEKQMGVIYHIDIKTKSILQKIEGLDALTLTLVAGDRGKHLLVGASRESKLYAYKIKKGKIASDPKELITLENTNEYIRKVKVKSKNRLELQTIPFSYSLVVQTSKKDRMHYNLEWSSESREWKIRKIN